MQRLLAIETSSEACSVALLFNGEIREKLVHAPLMHAELLLPMVQEAMAESGLALNSLDAIVFGRGPGSFTSLRIGIGVVQGLAWGADIPVVPVSSLQSVAQQAWHGANKEPPMCQRFLVAVDARMGEVFHCQYRAGADGLVQAEGPEAVAQPGSVGVTDAGFTMGLGNGFERYPELVALALGLLGVDATIGPSAAALIPLAQQWLQHHQGLPASEAQPVYVRNQVAEKPEK